MKLSGLIKYSLILFSVVLFVKCEENSESLPDDPVIKLSATKSPGQGQYKEKIESGEEINVNVDVSSSSGLNELTITKTVNLQTDSSYGENGVVKINPSSGTTFQYPFNYVPSVDDVDQLVGFTFSAKNADGLFQESDLTLVVTLSPRDNLPRRRWLLKSILHVNNPDEPNMEVIKECEKDNSMLLNADSTMTVDYGEDTGANGCEFDGFNEYESWYLTGDEKLFIRKSHGIFTPDVTVIDTFRVEILTVERIGLEQTVDLTVFGGAKDEKFLYIYDAVPK